MSNIVGKECKFVIHIPKIDSDDPTIAREDTHIVKERLHYEDGTTKPNLRIITNFKRPFWVTKQFYQNHKDKKESEELDKLDVHYSTESDLAKNAAARLGSRYIGVTDMRLVRNSPYIYGIDTSSTAILKNMYNTRYPDYTSQYTVSVLDIETDILTDEITMVTLALKDKIYQVVTRNYFTLANYPLSRRILDKIDYIFGKYMPDTDIDANRERILKIVDNELELIKLIFKFAHQEQPDFMAIWNIDFEMKNFLRVCDDYGVDPKDVFSDPTIPENLRYFKYKEAPKSRKTASGVFKSVSPEEQWNVVLLSASFWMIDAMSAHRYVRVGGKTTPGGYSLMNILNQDLGDKYGKLKFEDYTENQGPEWHLDMSRNHPIEYMVYNNRDCTSILDLDRKTNDLSVVLPMLSGDSGFDIFNSGPKKIVDGMHFFYLEKGRVLGCKPSNMPEDKILSLKDWIILLPSHRIANNGLKVINQNPDLRINTRGHVYDSDKYTLSLYVEIHIEESI